MLISIKAICGSTSLIKAKASGPYFSFIPLNLEAIKSMYQNSVCRDPERFKKAFENDCVYILTKYASEEYEVEKKKLLN